MAQRISVKRDRSVSVSSQRGPTHIRGSSRGPTGPQGPAAAGIRLTFDTATADADPGAGKWRANNATFASITKLWIDNAQVGGGDITAWLDALDDGGSSTHRCVLRIENLADSTQWAEFNVTGSVVDKTGYRELTVAPRAHVGFPFTNATSCLASQSRTGVTGADGAPGGVTSVNTLTGVVTLSFRDLLTTTRIYYVNGSTGSDSNNGLTSGAAFLTIQKAIDVAASLDLGIYSVTIIIADGTYTQALTLKSYSGTGPITLQGNISTPANVHISISGGAPVTASDVRGSYSFTGIKFTVASGGYYCINASGIATTVNLGVVDFGATGNAHIRAANGARILCTSNYSISGGGPNHWEASNHGILQAAGITITITGTPAFSVGFAYSRNEALLICNGNGFSGSATGARYNVSNGATIDTGAAGTTYLPGNAAGTGTNYGTSPYGLYN